MKAGVSIYGAVKLVSASKKDEAYNDRILLEQLLSGNVKDKAYADSAWCKCDGVSCDCQPHCSCESHCSCDKQCKHCYCHSHCECERDCQHDCHCENDCSSTSYY